MRAYQLNIRDITDPSSPSTRDVVAGGFHTDEMLFGRRLFDLQYNQLVLWDLGDAAATMVGSAFVAVGSGARIDRDGDRVAVTGGGGTTTLIDVSTPTAPRIVASGASGTDGRDVAIRGDRVYARHPSAQQGASRFGNG